MGTPAVGTNWQALTVHFVQLRAGGLAIMTVKWPWQLHRR